MPIANMIKIVIDVHKICEIYVYGKNAVGYIYQIL